MNIYLIVSGDFELLPDVKQKLETAGNVKIITHKGKLDELKELQQDSSEKVLGLDPDSFEWDLDIEAVKKIPNIKAICTSSTSYDWIKPIELKKLGIIGTNCPGFSTDAVAEYAVALAIDVSRRLPIHIKNNWKIDWTTRPMLLKGKRAGVIGLGKIGKRMAEILSGIGMEVVYWSKNTRDERFTLVELDELFKTADLIMPALKENEDTQKIITHDLIDRVKTTTIFVGINRVKDLIHEDYILEKVAQGKIGGYAFEGDNYKNLDTYKGNVWALPPIAWYTKESLDNLNSMWIENVMACAQGNAKNIITI